MIRETKVNERKINGMRPMILKIDDAIEIIREYELINDLFFIQFAGIVVIVLCMCLDG